MSLSVSLPPSASEEELPTAVESSDVSVHSALDEIRLGSDVMAGGSDAGSCSPGPNMSIDDSCDSGDCAELPTADDEHVSALDEDPEFVDDVEEGVDLLHLAIDEQSVLVVPLPTVAAHLTSSQDFAEFYSPPRVLPAVRARGLGGVLSLDIVNGWDFEIASVRESLWNYKYMSRQTFALRWQQGMTFLEHSMECAKAQ
eukprot:9487338-Pyramimonas_sp.AAC.1